MCRNLRAAVVLLYLGVGGLMSWPIEVQAQQVHVYFRVPRVVKAEVKRYRTLHHAPSLSYDARLNTAAGAYAKFLAQTNNRQGAPAIHFADGKSPQQRANEAGFRCNVSENVAASWASPNLLGRQAALRAMNFWENSPGHASTMRNPNFTLAGLGVGAWRHGNEDFWVFVMLFSGPCK